MGGYLAHEEALTNADGRFELELRGYDRKLSVWTRLGESAAHPIPRPVPGVVLDSINIEVRGEFPFAIQLLEASIESGHPTWCGANTPHARLVLDAPEGALHGTHLTLPIQDSGTVLVAPSILKDRHVAGTLLVSSYQAKGIEFRRNATQVDVALARLPQAVIRLTGTAIDASHSITVCVSPKPAVLNRQGRISDVPFRRVAFNLLEQVTTGVPMDAPAPITWARTNRAWEYVKTYRSASQVQADIVAFGPLDGPPGEGVELLLNLSEPDLPADVPLRDPSSSAATTFEDNRPASLRLRAISSTAGRPVEHASLRSDGVQGARVHSDPRGTVRGSAQPGLIRATLVADGFRPLELQPFTVEPLEQVDLGELALEPLRSLNVQLSGHDDQPLAHPYTVMYDDAELGSQSSETQRDGTSTLQFTDKPPRAVRLRIQHAASGAYACRGIPPHDGRTRQRDGDLRGATVALSSSRGPRHFSGRTSPLHTRTLRER